MAAVAAMKIVAIIQARMGSTRLPGKVLLPLAEKPMLQHLIERVQRATTVQAIRIAYPDPDSNESAPIRNLVEDLYDTGVRGYSCGSRPQEDVVGRYVDAAEFMNADLIVRIPGDNPCVEPWAIDRAVSAYLDQPCVFYSSTICNVVHGTRDYWVDGLGAEVFSMSRLKWLDEKTQGHPAWREHPHQYFYDHGVVFDHPADVRLDVNTQADYEFVKDIYEALYPSNPSFGIQNILTYLDTKEVLTHA